MTIPAVSANEEMSPPNCWAEMLSWRINCGPSGIMTMKSMIWVNWTAASKRRRFSSDKAGFFKSFCKGNGVNYQGQAVL
jgi:hypothetical protein